MSFIEAAIDAIAKRCRGSAKKDHIGRNAHEESLPAVLREGTGHSAETSVPNPQSYIHEEFPYFEFACCHASGLCLSRMKGIE